MPSADMLFDSVSQNEKLPFPAVVFLIPDPFGSIDAVK